MNNKLIFIIATLGLLVSCKSEFSSEQAALSSSEQSPKADVVSAGEFGSAEANRSGLPIESNISIKLTFPPIPSSVNEHSLFVTKGNDVASNGLSLAANDFNQN